MDEPRAFFYVPGTMQIQKDVVAAIEYTLKDDEGNTLDSSVGRQPLHYLHGHRNIVPGLEAALLGKGIGDQIEVIVEAKDGYGEYDASRSFEVPKSELPPNVQPAKGMQLTMHGAGGMAIPVTVQKVKLQSVVLDGNHPLAGKRLHFTVHVKELRKAKKEELAHGHAHGPGHGHGH